MHRFFPALASMTGARVAEVVVNHQPRRFGCSKYGMSRVFKVFSDIFATNLLIRFSSNPLKGFTTCSVLFLLLSLCFGALCTAAVLWGWTPGKALIFLILSALNLIAAIQLIMLGVLGELIVNVSDLTHTDMSKLSKKKVPIG
jgi:dolichol-phosphate mannosyltransferase